MAVSGAISVRARSNLPTTWDRLIAFDDEMVQTIIDDVKYQLFGTVISPGSEATTYTNLVLEYTGKLVAIAIIPAAVDYWMNQPVSLVTTGTEETESYPDRIAALWELQERLMAQAKALEADVFEETEIVTRATLGTPLVSDAGKDLVTSDPGAFQRAFELPPTTP